MTALFSKVKFAPIFSLSKVLLIASVLLAMLLQPVISAYAAPALTVTPITWNVIGLDSNNVNVGPNNFPVGARVCNTGDAASNVTATFVWDDGGNLYTGDPYINLRSGSLSTISIASLAAGTASSPSCYDFYFEVSITRNSNAYDHTRRYHINVTATGLGTLSTPTPREIYVEHLISQNRNSVTDVKYGPNASSLTSVAAGGTMSLVIGNTYTIELIGGTATQGYNQLEDFINFPNTIFQVLSVQSTYSADSSTFVANSSDKLYADACLWDSDPTSPTYRSCIGSDGKTGGSITTTYTVKIIGGAGTTQTLNTLIYDFSGSSYHYNSDFSTAARYAYISSPLTMSKSFSPVSIAGDGTSTLSIAITNTSASAVTGVTLSDPLPTSPAQMSVASTPAATVSAGCVSPTFAPGSGATTITYSGGVAASSTCTLTVNVTAATDGTYTNTTGDLFINGSDTGTNASANLTVASTTTGTGLCATGQTLAQWTVLSTATNPPDNTGGAPTTQAAYVTTATAAATSGLTTSINNKGQASATSGSWDSYGYSGTTQYITFTLDTSQVSNVQMSWYDSYFGSNAPTQEALYYNTGSGDQLATTITTFVKGFGNGLTQKTFDFTNKTNPSGNTVFKFVITTGGTSSQYDFALDEIDFSGTHCGSVTNPTITKTFTPATIGASGTSQLQFTLTNPNATVGLTGVAFSDTLPSGVTVSGTPTTPQCGGTISSTSNSITLTGGTIAASSNCTVTLNVTAASAGVYNNTSGFITSTESGTNSGSGGSASATLTVLAPPTISKSFSPNPIYASGTSMLTFTITNPNASSGLSSVGFTDVFPTTPGAMTLASTTTINSCGGSLTDNSGNPLSTSPASVGIQLSGGSLSAGGSCTVSVLTTASATGSYANTSGNVSAVISGVTYNGNTASDTLGVQTTHPGISVLKQVSTSASGPWDSTINVAPSGNVYYRFTIENTGDVPLSPVSVTDNTLNISSCTWPSTLPVGTSTVDPTATCIVGPITAQTTGSLSNTATAHGTYNSTVYDSTPSTATYAITTLALVKSVTNVTGTGSTSTSFGQAGNVITYDYTITNTGSASLPGPVTVTDSNSTVNCPSVTTVGNGDDNLDQNESIVCTATYTVTAFDVSVGSVTNTAYATVDGVTSNRDSKTVYMNLPDLVVSKTNDTGGYAYNQTPFNWTLTVSNNGPLDATFSSGQTILSDQLPTTGASYGALPATLTIGSSTGITGTINCSIDASALLTCTASGGSVTIGRTTGSFAIDIAVTPTAVGNLTNPKAIVNPPTSLSPLTYAVAESNYGNNQAADSVTVVNALPVANDDSGTTPANTALDSSSTGTGQSVNNASILTNDTGTNITLNSVTGTGAACTSFPCTITTTHGQAVVASDGTYTYTPTTDYSGPDSFTYQIQDSANQTANATVNLTITPVANDDGIYSVPYNTTSTGGGASILTNDTGTSLTVTSITGTSTCTSFPCTVNTTHGSVTVQTDGTFSYTPASNYYGSDSFTYIAQDSSNQDTNTATVSFNVQKPTAPVANDDSGTTPANTALDSSSTGTGQSVNNASILTNDTGTNITLNSVTGTGAACTSFPCTITTTHGQAVVASDGTYTYTPTTGYSGPDSFTYQIQDSANQTANATVNLTITPVSSLTGTVFNDANANGTQDSSEGGIGNVTIELQDGTCTPGVNCPTTQTASDGSYSFTGLTGGNYTVVETDPNGYVSTTSNIMNVTVPSSGTAQADFGDRKISGTSTNSISGTVFEDANANGILDNGESVLSGVTVTLYDQNNNVVAIATTATNGTYNFNNLPAGVYTVVETNPSGYISTTLDHVSVVLSSSTNVVVNYGDQKNTATVIDPAVTKYGDPSNAQVGDLVTYTITVGNNGNTDALNVVLTDTKPAFLDIISVNVSPNKGFTVNISGNTFTIDFGTVTPTDFYTVTVLTRVNSLGKAPGGANNASITTSSLGDPVFNNAASATLTIPASSSGGGTKANALPSTGFAPGVITTTAPEPANIYNTSTDLTIEIPALGVKTSIVGVPQSGGSWTITWLGNQVGYLDGTAFPTWSGNSVLTGHIYGANGLPGPFVNLHTLKWGDQVIIHFAGQRYIYEVRENKIVSPSDMSAFKHENRPWITLITCKDYNASTNTYDHRVEVGAVLVKIESDTSSSSAGR